MSNFVLSKPFTFLLHSPYYFEAKPRHLDLIIYTEELPKYLCIFVEIVLISFHSCKAPLCIGMPQAIQIIPYLLIYGMFSVFCYYRFAKYTNFI